jgi:hypothetical protein
MGINKPKRWGATCDATHEEYLFLICHREVFADSEEELFANLAADGWHTDKEGNVYCPDHLPDYEKRRRAKEKHSR